MNFLKKLIQDGTEIAATAIAQAVVTGADIIEDAHRTRDTLGRKFEEKATAASQKVEKTRRDLAQAFENHVNAFADALEQALDTAEAGRHPAPQPEATVSAATPETVEETKKPAAPAKKQRKPRQQKPR
jgi:hypothetical protein